MTKPPAWWLESDDEEVAHAWLPPVTVKVQAQPDRRRNELGHAPVSFAVKVATVGGVLKINLRSLAVLVKRAEGGWRETSDGTQELDAERVHRLVLEVAQRITTAFAAPVVLSVDVASEPPRGRTRGRRAKLPGTAQLKAEYERLKAQHGQRGQAAWAIVQLAKKYDCSKETVKTRVQRTTKPQVN